MSTERQKKKKEEIEIVERTSQYTFHQKYFFLTSSMCKDLRYHGKIWLWELNRRRNVVFNHTESVLMNLYVMGNGNWMNSFSLARPIVIHIKCNRNEFLFTSENLFLVEKNFLMNFKLFHWPWDNHHITRPFKNCPQGIFYRKI